MATQVREKSSAKYDAFIATQLSRVEQRIRFVDLMTAMGLLLSSTLAFAILMILLDRQFVLSAASRQMALLFYLVGACVYTWYGIVRPLTWRVNPYYAARQLEGSLPENRNRLVNWIDLHDQKHLPSVFRSALGQRAARDLSATDVDQAISNRRAVAVGAMAGLFLVFFIGLFLWIGPAPFRSLLARAFAPFSASAGIATRTHVSIVRPEDGNAVVTIGQPITIVALVEGRLPDVQAKDAPCLLYRHDPSEPYRQRYLQPDDAQREWSTTINAIDVGNGFTYKVTAGDGSTPEYQVRVRAAPLIVDFLATYHYRPYTQKVSRSRTQRKLEDLRGTRVDILARTNRVLREGRLDFERADGVIDLIRAELRADDPQALRFSLVLDQPGKYRLRFTSLEGETYFDPIAHEVAILPDLPPQVRLTKPAKDVTLPLNGHLPLEGEASDDHGIARLILKLRVQDGPTLADKPYLADKLGKPGIGTPRQLQYRDLLDLTKITNSEGKPAELKPGMVLEYWLQASDGCDTPRPNVTDSEPPYKITLAAAADPKEQQQKNEQAHQQQQQNEQQQQEQLQQQQAEREEQNRQEEQQEQADNRQRDQQRQDGTQDENNEPGSEGKQPDNKEENKSEPKKGQEKGGNKGEGQKNADPKDNQPGEDQQGENKEGEGKGGQKEKDEQTQKAADNLKRALERREQEKNQGNEAKEAGEARDGGEKKESSENKPGEGKPAGENKPDAGDPRPQNEPKPGENKPGQSKGDKENPADKPGESKGNEENKPGENKPGESKSAGDSQENRPGENQPGQSKEKGQPKEGGPNEEKPGQSKPTGQPQPKGGDNQPPGKEQNNRTNSPRPSDQKPAGENKPTPQPKDGESKPGECKECQGEGKSGADGTKPGNSKGAGGQKGPSSPEQPSKGQNSNDKGAEKGAGSDQGKPRPAPEDARPEDVQQRAQDLQSKDAQQRGQAARDLKEMAEKARDPATRQSAREALEQAGKEDQPSKEPSKGQEKGAKGSEQPGKEEGNRPDQKGDPAAKDGDKGQQQPGKGRPKGKSDTSDRPGEGRDTSPDASEGNNDPEQPARPEKARSARATQLQLEEFRKRVDPDVLRDANMSKEQFEQFLRDYAELANRQQQQADQPEKLPMPGQVGGPRTSLGGRTLKPTGSGTSDDLRNSGRPKPPPEYREAHNQFLRLLQKQTPPR